MAIRNFFIGYRWFPIQDLRGKITEAGKSEELREGEYKVSCTSGPPLEGYNLLICLR